MHEHSDFMCKYSETDGVEQDSEEQLSSVNEPIQLLRAAGIVLVKDGVCEQTTRLPGQDLIKTHKCDGQSVLQFRLYVCVMEASSSLTHTLTQNSACLTEGINRRELM